MHEFVTFLQIMPSDGTLRGIFDNLNKRQFVDNGTRGKLIIVSNRKIESIISVQYCQFVDA